MLSGFLSQKVKNAGRCRFNATVLHNYRGEHLALYCPILKGRASVDAKSQDHYSSNKYISEACLSS